jgi:predicted amidohydrolase YtcJ
VRLYLVPWERGSEVEQVRYWVENVEPGEGDDWLRYVGLGEIFTFGCHDLEGLESFPVRDGARRDLREITSLLARSGWPGHIHAILDSTIEAVLDVWTEVAEDVGGLPRFSLAHAEFIGERSLGRAKDLGIGIAVQNRLMFRAAESVTAWGGAAVSAAPPLRDILDLEIPLGAGTDGTVASAINPWHSIGWLVGGRSVDGASPRAERHRLTRQEALSAYTSGSAWFSLEEGKRGTLRPGVLADLAVLTDDLFTVDEDEIPDIRALLTLVGGRIVHADGPFADLLT